MTGRRVLGYVSGPHDMSPEDAERFWRSVPAGDDDGDGPPVPAPRARADRQRAQARWQLRALGDDPDVDAELDELR